MNEPTQKTSGIEDAIYHSILRNVFAAPDHVAEVDGLEVRRSGDVVLQPQKFLISMYNMGQANLITKEQHDQMINSLHNLYVTDFVFQGSKFSKKAKIVVTLNPRRPPNIHILTNLPQACGDVCVELSTQEEFRYSWVITRESSDAYFYDMVLDIYYNTDTETMQKEQEEELKTTWIAEEGLSPLSTPGDVLYREDSMLTDKDNLFMVDIDYAVKNKLVTKLNKNEQNV